MEGKEASEVERGRNARTTGSQGKANRAGKALEADKAW